LSLISFEVEPCKLTNSYVTMKVFNKILVNLLQFLLFQVQYSAISVKFIELP